MNVILLFSCILVYTKSTFTELQYVISQTMTMAFRPRLNNQITYNGCGYDDFMASINLVAL